MKISPSLKISNVLALLVLSIMVYTICEIGAQYVFPSTYEIRLSSLSSEELAVVSGSQASGHPGDLGSDVRVYPENAPGRSADTVLVIEAQAVNRGFSLVGRILGNLQLNEHDGRLSISRTPHVASKYFALAVAGLVCVFALALRSLWNL
ncbi:MAG: hypothetical protein GVY32_07880 [Gammaproteobacteria bacterium]|jgi:hypothetical protein|nr:hypothetical protein [Gammaproteobacteria bacterium]